MSETERDTNNYVLRCLLLVKAVSYWTLTSLLLSSCISVLSNFGKKPISCHDSASIDHPRYLVTANAYAIRIPYIAI